MLAGIEERIKLATQQPS